ncbi:sulfurtransferase [Microbacterium sp. bgisy203]|uniref:sulfurtransferase n=1 Tax=Microbacterium sp. bgisy203 TaxID=3413799 RepID=UPI003D719179
MSSPLVSAPELAAEIAHGARPRLLDVRWRLDRPEGRPDYLEGHLPGAVYVDLERELAAPGHPEAGRHPLPTDADLHEAVRRWGVNVGDRVVVYDDNEGVPAARAWWLLRRNGIDVRLLDGGLRAWFRHGLRLERGDTAVRRGTWSGESDYRDAVADIDDAALAPHHGVLVDVRAPQHYRGAVAGLDPAAGHIPGAVNIPTVTHIGPDGLLRGPSEIRATLAVHGIVPGTRVVLSCASGIPSMHSALAFETAGVTARVFVGSWSLWSRSAGRPIAIGASPFDVVVAGY